MPIPLSARLELLYRKRRLERHRRGPCARDTYRCKSATDMKQDTSPCCRSHVRNITRDIARSLDEVGIPYWADYGTLLGAARHGGMIPWDKDGDLGAYEEDFDRAADVLKSMGGQCRYNVRVRRKRISIKVRLSELNKTNVDLFFWRPMEGNPGVIERQVYAAVDQYKGKEFPREWLEPFVRLPFEDFEVSAPNKWDLLLRHRYGNWETPIRSNNDGVKR